MKHIGLAVIFGMIAVLLNAQQLGYYDIPSSNKKSLFRDDFEDNRNNWWKGDNTYKVYFEYGYMVFKSTGESSGSHWFPMQHLSDNMDWEIETRIRFVSGEDNNFFGFFWDRDEKGNLHRFGFAASGYYQINKNYDGKWINDGTNWYESSLVKKYEWNKLTVRKLGDKLHYFINETWVYTHDYPSMYGNKIGFTVNSNSTMNVDYLYMYEISSPPPAIVWISPSGSNTSVSSQEYTVKFKVTTATQISEAVLLVNGFPSALTSNLIKYGNDYFGEKAVSLNQGNNQVVLTVKVSGAQATQSCQIIYNPSQIATAPVQQQPVYQQPYQQPAYQQPAYQQPSQPQSIPQSDVDNNIPENPKNTYRFALIIGNEDYASYQRTVGVEANVAYAVNDALKFKEYCIKTLGVEERNVFYLANATTGAMNQNIDLITKIASKLSGKAEIIFYYAGHGLPDEITKVPYLIPVDVNAANLTSAIKLNEVYQKFSDCGAKRITVFLDACFSGGGREAGLLSARSVRVKPKEEVALGNLVVFTASSGEQSSLPYKEKGHGMFTYWLLKHLQQTKGKSNYGEMAKFINENVSVESLRTNYKEQDPQVNVSPSLANTWKSWTF